MLTKTQKAAVASVQTLAKKSMESLVNFDFAPAYKLDARLKANKTLLKEFIKNPVEVAKREVGLEVPKGFHMHFINEKNEYFPPEGVAIAQLHSSKKSTPWTRVEIRSAVGRGCLAVCGICK